MLRTATPIELDSSPQKSPSRRPKKARLRLNRWRCSYITPVAKQGSSVELLNRAFVGDNTHSDSMTLMASLPEYMQISQPWLCGCLAKKTRRSHNITLVLDLDETLIHATCDPTEPHDLKVVIEDGADSIDVFVSIRPFVKEFIAEVTKHFEVVLFTAAEKDYADKIMSVLDPGRLLIRHRLYRDSCTRTDDVYVKDLNILGRDIEKTLIVDNTLHAFAYQLDNGVLIRSYEGDKTDEALPHLLKVLVAIKDADDVRVALKNFTISRNPWVSASILCHIQLGSCRIWLKDRGSTRNCPTRSTQSISLRSRLR